MAKPFIIFVPGAFGHPDFYGELAKAVAAAGIEIKVLHLPTVGLSPGVGREGAPPSMYDDAAFIAEETTRLADEGREVIIVTHSYGGVPTTESAKGLGKEERLKQGKKGGIIRIAYITALAPAVGSSAVDVLTKTPQENKLEFEVEENGWMSQNIAVAAPLMFPGLPKEESEAWISGLPKHSAPSFTSPLTHAGYKDIPVSYLVCEDDLVLPVNVQKDQIESIERESKDKVNVTSIKTGHCPMITEEKIVVRWILDMTKVL